MGGTGHVYPGSDRGPSPRPGGVYASTGPAHTWRQIPNPKNAWVWILNYRNILEREAGDVWDFSVCGA